MASGSIAVIRRPAFSLSKAYCFSCITVCSFRNRAPINSSANAHQSATSGRCWSIAARILAPFIKQRVQLLSCGSSRKSNGWLRQKANTSGFPIPASAKGNTSSECLLIGLARRRDSRLGSSARMPVMLSHCRCPIERINDSIGLIFNSDVQNRVIQFGR